MWKVMSQRDMLFPNIPKKGLQKTPVALFLEQIRTTFIIHNY